MADLQLTYQAQILELGSDDEGRPSVALRFENGQELSVILPSIEHCRSLAPSLLDRLTITVSIPMPEVRRG